MPIDIKKISDQKDPKVAFKENFADLVVNDEDKEILQSLSEQVKSVEFKDGNAIFELNVPEFKTTTKITDEPGYVVKENDKVSKSYIKTVATHGSVLWEVPGGGAWGYYGIDPETSKVKNGGWEYEAIDDNAEDNADFIGSLEDCGLTTEDVDEAFDYGQNWIIFDPSNRTDAGDLNYCFISHGDCVVADIRSAKGLTFGQTLLRVMSQSILGTKHFEEVYN